MRRWDEGGGYLVESFCPSLIGGGAGLVTIMFRNYVPHPQAETDGLFSTPAPLLIVRVESPRHGNGNLNL